MCMENPLENPALMSKDTSPTAYRKLTKDSVESSYKIASAIRQLFDTVGPMQENSGGCSNPEEEY